MSGGNQDPRFWTSSLFNQTLFQRFLNPTTSNINVTSESAYQLASYWLAVRAISEDIAKLPINLFTVSNDGKKTPLFNSPLQKVLTQGFNDETDSMTGLQTLVQWMLTFGNGYAEILRNGLGDIQLQLIHPSRVSVQRNGDGVLFYEVTTRTELDSGVRRQRSTTISAADMLHLKGPGNGVVGYSIGEIAANSLGISIAAQDFTGAFFGNNLSIGAALETDRALDADTKASISKEWKKKFGGSKNAGEMAILDRGFKFNRLQMSSTDAELLSTRKFQVEEIARWFRIPPHKLMDMSKSSFNNVEQQDINYSTDTLTPWIRRVEVQLKFKFHRTDNTVIDIDEKALSRGDMKARSAFLKEMFAMGSMSRNEVRRSEGLEEVEGGDAFYIPMNLTPVTEGTKSAELDNDIKAQSLEVVEDIPTGEDPETTQRISKLKFESLEAKVNSYGGGVRAGLVTPQKVDEQRMRSEMGLPPMSPAVSAEWASEGGVRRPITLVSQAQEDIEEAQAGKAKSATPQATQSSVTEQAAIAAYLPTMKDSFSRLTRKESLSHTAADKKEPQAQLEHLNKFYAKFESELSDCLELHANYLCNILSKEKFTSDKLLFMSQEICQLEKLDNQADIIVEKILQEVAGMSEAPQLGEIRTGEDKKNYIFTMTGWSEVEVLKK